MIFLQMHKEAFPLVLYAIEVLLTGRCAALHDESGLRYLYASKVSPSLIIT